MLRGGVDCPLLFLGVLEACLVLVENGSFAPSGLDFLSAFYPRLAPWAAFFRRFVARAAPLSF